MKSTIEVLEARLEEIKDAQAQVEAELETAKAVPVNVTEELKVEIARHGGDIRLYLTHNGSVIIRAGAGKPLSLTDYAREHGYAIVTGAEGLRGYWFRVTQKDC